MFEEREWRKEGRARIINGTPHKRHHCHHHHSSRRMTSYEGSFSYSFQILRNLGLWKSESENPWKIALYNWYQCIALTYLFIVMLLPCIDFVLSLNDIRKWSFNLCFIITAVATFFKSCAVLWNSKAISELRKDLNRDLSTESDENRKVLQMAAKEVKTLFKTVMTMGYILYVFWMCIPLHSTEDHPLPLQMWLPFDTKVSPNYQIAYFFHAAVGFFLVMTVFGTDGTIVAFTIRICAEYDILKNSIAQFFRELADSTLVADGKTAAKFRDIIRHHQRIIEYVERLRAVYHHLLTFQFIGSVILLLIIGLDIILVSGTQTMRLIVQIQYGLVTLSDLFLYCIYGSQLIEKSKELGNAVFGSEWYVMTPTYQRGFAFIMQRSQKCPRIVIGRMYSMTLNFYLQVLRVTYNILAVLWQVTSAEQLQNT